MRRGTRWGCSTPPASPQAAPPQRLQTGAVPRTKVWVIGGRALLMGWRRAVSVLGAAPGSPSPRSMLPSAHSRPAAAPGSPSSSTAARSPPWSGGGGTVGEAAREHGVAGWLEAWHAPCCLQARHRAVPALQAGPRPLVTRLLANLLLNGSHRDAGCQLPPGLGSLGNGIGGRAVRRRQHDHCLLHLGLAAAQLGRQPHLQVDRRGPRAGWVGRKTGPMAPQVRAMPRGVAGRPAGQTAGQMLRHAGSTAMSPDA